MAISGAHIGDHANAANQSSYTWTAAGGDTDLAANKLYLLGVTSGRGGGNPAPATPTVTQTGVTWVKVLDHTYTAESDEAVYVFRTIVGGAVTGENIVVAFGGTTMANISISLDEFSGIDTSGSQGSGAIVQSLGNDGADSNSIAVTLSAFADADNRPYSATRATDGFITSFTPDLDTELYEVNQDGNNWAHVQWDSSTADNTITVTPVGAAAVDSWGIIGVEIKVASAGPPQTGLVRVEFS